MLVKKVEAFTNTFNIFWLLCKKTINMKKSVTKTND